MVHLEITRNNTEQSTLDTLTSKPSSGTMPHTILQQILTIFKYCQKLSTCYLLSKYILSVCLAIKIAKICPTNFRELHNHSFSTHRMHFVDNLLHKTVILPNLAEHRRILANLAYGLVSLVSGGIIHTIWQDNYC